MTKQFTDKLTNTLELFRKQCRGKTGIGFEEARQQILAAIAEAAPTPNPKEWAVNLPQLAWTIGYEKGVADFLKALGIEKGEE